MEKYEETRSCPKCEGEAISTRYDKPSPNAIEYIQRGCSRCGYSWNEIPLDEK